jgi:putative OPT family oligopeptide transporter
MYTESKNEPSFAGVKQLSIRSLLLGILGSCIITASSMYVALRMGALPWPTIFVAILSMALLKSFGRTTLNEINITQTAMSAGAMVAGGLAFTLPGLWISGGWSGSSMLQKHFWPVLWIALAGVLLGTVFTWFLRKKYVKTDVLPYPIGVAAAQTINIGDTGGKKSFILFGTLGLSAVFTYLRDGRLHWIPSTLSSKWLYTKNFFVGIWLSPMAAGIGYIIGPLYTGIWFLGALLSYFLIVPLGTAYKLFPSISAAIAFKNIIGIGLMVGSGLGIIVAYIISLFQKQITKRKRTLEQPEVISPKFHKRERFWTVLAVAIAFILSIACGLGPIPSLLLMVGVLIVSTMSAIITGETGVNPMEIFAIIVLLAMRVVIRLDVNSAFFVAAGVAVTCGYAGDLLNDYKAGHILGTNPVAQLILHIVGGFIGAIIATLAMFAVIQQFGGVGPEKGLPAVQAFAVSQMINGIGHPLIFGGATIIGMLLYLLRVPVLTLGLGMYVSFELSAALFLGGVARLIIDRIKPNSTTTGNIIASGFFGGEGITGVGIAIVKMFLRG